MIITTDINTPYLRKKMQNFLIYDDNGFKYVYNRLFFLSINI